MILVMIDVNPFKLIYTSDVHHVHALLGGNVEGKETSLFRSNRAKGEESRNRHRKVASREIDVSRGTNKNCRRRRRGGRGGVFRFIPDEKMRKLSRQNLPSPRERWRKDFPSKCFR